MLPAVLCFLLGLALQDELTSKAQYSIIVNMENKLVEMQSNKEDTYSAEAVSYHSRENL